MQEKTLQSIFQATKKIEAEVGKVIIGKEDVIHKVLMAILANGHILLDDVPGVGKTSLAVALGKTLGLEYNRIQCTPDVLPSDIVGFSVFNRESDSFTYMPGIINNTNLLLADEINRTSSRTQAALLEAMEEHQVTVDGITHALPDPFIVIATENQVGAAGTQMLPHAQMDRFLVRLTVGYPDKESEIDIIGGRQTEDPYAGLRKIVTTASVKTMQRATLMVTIKDSLIGYIIDLTEASRSTSPRWTTPSEISAEIRRVAEAQRTARNSARMISTRVMASRRKSGLPVLRQGKCWSRYSAAQRRRTAYSNRSS